MNVVLILQHTVVEAITETKFLLVLKIGGGASLVFGTLKIPNQMPNN